MFHVYLNRLFFGDEVTVVKLRAGLNGFLLLPTRDQMLVAVGRMQSGFPDDSRITYTLFAAHLVSPNHPGVFKMRENGGPKDQGELWSMMDVVEARDMRMAGIEPEHNDRWAVVCK